MSRYFLYLAVALLAFAIGSTVVYIFYIKNNAVSEINTGISKGFIDTQDKLKNFEIATENTQTDPNNTFVCNDKTLNELRGELKTDEFLENYDKYNENQTLDCTEIYEVKKADLNRDGREELIVKGNIMGLCNMKVNCQLWIFRQTKDGYKRILYNEIAFKYEIKNTFTNGFADFKIASNRPALSDGNFYTYKFDGKKYKVKVCFSEHYSKNDKEFKKPVFIREKCEELLDLSL